CLQQLAPGRRRAPPPPRPLDRDPGHRRPAPPPLRRHLGQRERQRHPGRRLPRLVPPGGRRRADPRPPPPGGDPLLRKRRCPGEGEQRRSRSGRGATTELERDVRWRPLPPLEGREGDRGVAGGDLISAVKIERRTTWEKRTHPCGPLYLRLIQMPHLHPL